VNSEIEDVLGPEGVLARQVEGFAYRPQQAEMAEATMQAIDQGTNLIAEAGTGTGKTFAYLVPALLSQKKVLISTGTRNLQDQLFLRDLPRVADVMASPARIAWSTPGSWRRLSTSSKATPITAIRSPAAGPKSNGSPGIVVVVGAAVVDVVVVVDGSVVVVVVGASVVVVGAAVVVVVGACVVVVPSLLVVHAVITIAATTGQLRRVRHTTSFDE